jgi:hypothetical protein
MGRKSERRRVTKRGGTAKKMAWAGKHGATKAPRVAPARNAVQVAPSLTAAKE